MVLGDICSVNYAVTLTLNPRFHVNGLEHQWDDIEKELHCIRLNQRFNVDWTMIVELTQTYNLHVHGIIRISGTQPRDVRRYLNDCFRKSNFFGRQRCIKAIDDEDKWITYLIKDYEHTRNALNCRDPIIFDELKKIPEMLRFPHYI